jgi:hypothetical protein
VAGSCEYSDETSGSGATELAASSKVKLSMVIRTLRRMREWRYTSKHSQPQSFYPQGGKLWNNEFKIPHVT